MADEQPEVLAKPGLTKEQKIGFTLLLVFGIITVALGVLQLRNTLYAPFALNNTVPVSIKEQVNTVDTLQRRDTDHDGLSDFDELYVYHTSPYLYDTFGYGMSDKEVMARGLPLCPGAGKFCSDEVGATTTEQNAGSTIATGLSKDPLLQNPPADLNSVLRDPKQLRQMLLQTGMDASILSKVSDSDLMLLASQLISSSSTFTNQSLPTSTVR